MAPNEHEPSGTVATAGEVIVADGPPFTVVMFDCDSTLSAIEGIDELARRAGQYDLIAPLTRAAMNGELSLEAVYKERLRVLQPDRRAIDWLADRYVEALVPDARATVAALQQLGKAVHVLSGGLLQAIQPLARTLGIDTSHVHAVSVYWDEQGAYAGFEERSPLARAHGKATVCAALRSADQQIALIGDGGTDLEAAAAGAYVIGFGGVVQRPLMLAHARHFVSGPSLWDVLGVVLTVTEYAALTRPAIADP
jgi:phosphoserine phosphatase